jgi:glycosyltransferase involved in cell wall biosynthesis
MIVLDNDRSHRYEVLTFDGSYRDNVSMARLIPERQDTPFLMYVPTGRPHQPYRRGGSDCAMRTDILAILSLSENLPMSAIEALAHGVVAIRAPVGALPDIIEHARTRLIVKPGDVDELVSALSRLAEHPDVRGRLGEGGKALRRAQLDIDVCAERLVAIWTQSVHAGEL